MILGTMNIEYPYTSAMSTNTLENRIHSYREIIETYLSACAGAAPNHKPLLDTAYYYANGKCEEILGEILPTLSSPVKIATKANPWFANDFTCGKYGQLAREPLTNQLLGSLRRLQQENVDAFFLHCPDPETPVKETLETCDELWRRERFDRFGVSNFSVGQLAEILEICETEKFNAPVIYQGMYNLVARKVEEIFPLIREHGIDFWAYNPLAGGLLTGKYAADAIHINNDGFSNSRFQSNAIYQNIFWKPAILETLITDFYYENETLEKKSEKKCITDAFQWVKSKLLLDKSEVESVEFGDRIILGASTTSQLLENMNAIHQNVCDYNYDYERLENIFSKIGEQSPNYFY
jgi:aflatoxin B1 aldehyde reductase